MGKILLGVVVAIVSVVLADSLICNTCAFGLGTFCPLTGGEETCSTNTSVCFNGTITFPSLSSFSGFFNQGCREPAGCNTTTNNTLLSVVVATEVSCCDTDRCNNGASSAQTSLAAAVGVAALVSVWGSVLQ